MQDSQKIPWKRIATEGGAIVVSILIAFWIDAWWQERSERITLVEYLVHFENEVVANDVLIDIRISEIAGDLVALHRVFLAMSDSDEQTLPASFNTDLGRALYLRSPTVSMNAFDELASSGNFRMVNNTQLKEAVNEYKNNADYLDTSYSWAISSYIDLVLPAISPHVVLSSLDWQQYDSHLGPDGENTGVTPNAPFSTNVGGIKSQAVWNALFDWKVGRIDESRTLKEMKVLGQNLRELLAVEVDYQNGQ